MQQVRSAYLADKIKRKGAAMNSHWQGIEHGCQKQSGGGL